MLFEPRVQAIRVVDMTTGHEHALRAHGNCLTTHCARRWLHLGAVLLAMLSFNLNNGQFPYRFLLRTFLPGSCLRFLLADSADHFNKVFFAPAAL